MAAVRVKALIEANKVMVFSKTYCPYCDKAKKVFNSIGAKYEVLELDQDADGNAIQDALHKMTGQRTVPNVFVGEKSIGGGSETEALQQSGELIPMLQSIGAL